MEQKQEMNRPSSTVVHMDIPESGGCSPVATLNRDE